MKIYLSCATAIAVCLAGCSPSFPTQSTPAQDELSIDSKVIYSEFSADQKARFAACDISESEFYRLLGLDHAAFDQDFSGGWRAISKREDCKDVAVDVLNAYIMRADWVHKQNRLGLIWHAGQVMAGSGRYNEAITYFEHSYKADEDQKDWNLYVDATLAFLRKDKMALQESRDSLAQIPVPVALKAARRKFLEDNPNITMPDGFVDNPGNLDVVDRLLKCFDQPYSEAYGTCKN